MFKLTETNRKWWILIAMTSCISMIFIDITVLPVALPTIQRELNFSQLALQWIVNAYTLSLTLFVLAGGRMGDRHGHRRIFCMGLFLFSLSSALCGFSNAPEQFILSRVLQGVGGAFLIPNSAAIIFSAFPPHQRGKAMGLYVSIGSIFLALGPFIGGVFSEYLSWRFVFWINLPIALIGYGLTLFAVKKTGGTRKEFDGLGFITSSIGISSIIIALMQAKDWGWTSPLTIGSLILGVSLLIFLYSLDRKVEDPYIDFALFRRRNFLGATFSIFCTQFLLMATVFWAIYFQNIFNYTPAQAGGISLLSNIPIMIVAPIGGHIFDKYGPRIPIAIGFSLIALSLFWFIQNLENRNIGMILSAIIPFGCGIPLIFTPSFTNAMAEVAPEKRGLASGTTTMMRQFGGTIGLAIMGTLFFSIQETAFTKQLQEKQVEVNIPPKRIEGLLSASPEAEATLRAIPQSDRTTVIEIYKKTFIKGFRAVNILGILMALMGLIFSFFLIRRARGPGTQ